MQDKVDGNFEPVRNFFSEFVKTHLAQLILMLKSEIESRQSVFSCLNSDFVIYDKKAVFKS